MAIKAAHRAEDLVYAVAFDELDLTDEELAQVDLSALIASTLAGVRIELRQAAGRSLTLENYLLPPKRPANVVDLFQALEERANRHRPVS